MSSFSMPPLPANRFRLPVFPLVASILFCAAPLLAQNDSGTILGTVRDPQGAVVVSAVVTVTNVNTAVAKSTPVTQSGEYAIPFLVPGAYSVSVEATNWSSTQSWMWE